VRDLLEGPDEDLLADELGEQVSIAWSELSSTSK
jgi:hypothetical protein